MISRNTTTRSIPTKEGLTDLHTTQLYEYTVSSLRYLNSRRLFAIFSTVEHLHNIIITIGMFMRKKTIVSPENGSSCIQVLVIQFEIFIRKKHFELPNRFYKTCFAVIIEILLQMPNL